MTAPAAAADAFADRLPQASRYSAWLTGAGIERGLLGPREADRVWSRHVLNSAALAALVPQGARVADVGSGAGLPGIPLLLARPDLTMTLIEPLQRRAAFLTEVVDDLGLAARVLRARAEEVREQFDVVVARAVAPLDRLVGWCAPLVAPGGMMLAVKGQTAAAELEQHTAAIRRAGVLSAELVALTAADGEAATVLVLRFTGASAR